MGQAKQRGSFETRQEQSVEARSIREKEKARKHAEWWNGLTPEQQETHQRRKGRLLGIFAMAGLLAKF